MTDKLYRWDASAALLEVIVADGALVEVKPTTHRMLWCFTHNEEVQFDSHEAAEGMCQFAWRRKEYRRIEGVPCDVVNACVVRVKKEDDDE